MNLNARKENNLNPLDGLEKWARWAEAQLTEKTKIAQGGQEKEKRK